MLRDRPSYLILLLAVIGLVSSVSSRPLGAQDRWATPINGNWLTNSNWLDGSAPTVVDDVAINAFGAQYDVTLFSSTSINSFALDTPDARLLAASGGGPLTLDVANNFDIFNGEIVTWGAYAFDATNGITNHGGIFHSTGHATTTVYNGFNNLAGAELKIRGVRNSSGTATFGAELNIFGGLTNAGTIGFETHRGTNGGTAAVLDVSGTLDNSGLIESRMFTGAGTGARLIRANTLSNSGTIINNDVSNLDLNLNGATYTNSGTINSAVGAIRYLNIQSFENQASGQMLGTASKIEGRNGGPSSGSNAGLINLSGELRIDRLDSFTNTGTINVGSFANDGSPTAFINDGAIAVAAGQAMAITAGSYDHRDGATLGGGGSLAITNADIFLENGFTTDFTSVNLGASTIQGSGLYQSQAGTSTFVTGTTVQNGVSWENSGFVSLQGTNTAIANFNSSFENLSGSELRVHGVRNSTGTINLGAKMNVAGALNNAGTISLLTTRGGAGGTFAWLDVAGTLTNSGTIDSRMFAGSATASRLIRTPALINSGVIEQNDVGRLDFSGANGVYTNSGSVNVNLGSMQFSQMDSFSNSGAINIADGASIRFLGDSFTNEVGGVIAGNGTFTGTSLTSFVDNGILRPGASPGILTLNVTNYIQQTTGILDMEIAGLVGGVDYDQLVLPSGTGTFNGTLRLTFTDGFAPSMGDEFNLILGNIVDNFQTVELFGLQPGFAYQTNTVGGSFTLEALNDASAVPEPAATMVLCFVCCAGVLRRRRATGRQAMI